MPPPKKADPPHKMVFTTNSLRNNTIAVDNDALYYEIVTRFWHPSLTKINKLDFETGELKTVAEIGYRTDGHRRGEVRVKFGGDQGEWMRAVDFINGGTFKGGQGVEYRWKLFKRRLQLVRADDEDGDPLVSYHPHRRHFFFFRMSRHAWLEIKPEATEAMERLIVSYLLMERRRRNAKLRVKVERS